MMLDCWFSIKQEKEQQQRGLARLNFNTCLQLLVVLFSWTTNGREICSTSWFNVCFVIEGDKATQAEQLDKARYCGEIVQHQIRGPEERSSHDHCTDQQTRAQMYWRRSYTTARRHSSKKMRSNFANPSKNRNDLNQNSLQFLHKTTNSKKFNWTDEIGN